MKNIIFILTLGVSVNLSINAQEFSGDWKGVLEIQGNELHLIIHIKHADGKFSSTMDSPDQSAFGIAMDETIIKENQISIVMKQMQIKITGTLNEQNNAIDATFNQGPMSLPLKLTKDLDVKITSVENENQSNDNPIIGDWNGAIEIQGTTLRLVYHISETDGVYSSTLDSPDQGAFGIAMDETVVNENEIMISMEKMKMKTTGTFDEVSNTIKGNFNQGPLNLPLTLTREEIAKKEKVRYQNPKSIDYVQEEVKFKNNNGGHFLAGTLTIPKSGKFEKVAILVSGSGPQNRNEELLGHKPFLVLSDFLTRNGIAVLRYDDRGIADSEGDFSTATSEDLAQDAEAALMYLKSRGDTKNKKFGIIGHSEGGMIAPMVASRNELDYIVLLAGPGIEINQLLAEQSKAILKASGMPDEEIQFSLTVSEMVFQYMKDNSLLSNEDLTVGLTKILKKEFENLPQKQKEEISDIDAEIKKQVDGVTGEWFKYFINFSPSVYLKQVKCPVLAINGSNDLQVLPKSNLAGIESALKAGGNTHFTIKELPGLNHLFQQSETGSPSEYGSIEETFNEEALKIVADWVNNYNK